MFRCIRSRQNVLPRRLISAFSVISFLLVTFVSANPGYAQSLPVAGVSLPLPGTMVSPSSAFHPPLLKGLSIDPDNPLQLHFIVDSGEENLKGDAFKREAMKLVKYFLASLTVPEKELWVNLSPHEAGRIIPEGFGRTEMGRDLLAQDYILKQLTASLLYPENDLGKVFWKRLQEKMKETYAVTDVPSSIFNKVWIVPDKAVVYVSGRNVFVVESHLKVMLEQDYVALQDSRSPERAQRVEGEDYVALKASGGAPDKISAGALVTGDPVTTQLMREIVLPEIEKEVNEGKNFANLRQIYQSMLLATWYKKALKESLLGRVYVDQNKTKGIDLEDVDGNRKIYEQYLEAYRKGVYNYIKEDYDPALGESIPRKYFSGGAIGHSAGQIIELGENPEVVDLALVSASVVNPQTVTVELQSDAAMAGTSTTIIRKLKANDVIELLRESGPDLRRFASDLGSSRLVVSPIEKFSTARQEYQRQWRTAMKSLWDRIVLTAYSDDVMDQVGVEAIEEINVWGTRLIQKGNYLKVKSKFLLWQLTYVLLRKLQNVDDETIAEEMGYEVRTIRSARLSELRQLINGEITGDLRKRIGSDYRFIADKVKQVKFADRFARRRGWDTIEARYTRAFETHIKNSVSEALKNYLLGEILPSNRSGQDAAMGGERDDIEIVSFIAAVLGSVVSVLQLFLMFAVGDEHDNYTKAELEILKRSPVIEAANEVMDDFVLSELTKKDVGTGMILRSASRRSGKSLDDVRAIHADIKNEFGGPWGISLESAARLTDELLQQAGGELLQSVDELLKNGARFNAARDAYRRITDEWIDDSFPDKIDWDAAISLLAAWRYAGENVSFDEIMQDYQTARKELENVSFRDAATLVEQSRKFKESLKITLFRHILAAEYSRVTGNAMSVAVSAVTIAIDEAARHLGEGDDFPGARALYQDVVDQFGLRAESAARLTTELARHGENRDEALETYRTLRRNLLDRDEADWDAMTILLTAWRQRPIGEGIEKVVGDYRTVRDNLPEIPYADAARLVLRARQSGIDVRTGINRYILSAYYAGNSSSVSQDRLLTELFDETARHLGAGDDFVGAQNLYQGVRAEFGLRAESAARLAVELAQHGENREEAGEVYRTLKRNLYKDEADWDTMIILLTAWRQRPIGEGLEKVVGDYRMVRANLPAMSHVDAARLVLRARQSNADLRAGIDHHILAKHYADNSSTTRINHSLAVLLDEAARYQDGGDDFAGARALWQDIRSQFDMGDESAARLIVELAQHGDNREQALEAYRKITDHLIDHTTPDEIDWDSATILLRGLRLSPQSITADEVQLIYKMARGLDKDKRDPDDFKTAALLTVEVVVTEQDQRGEIIPLESFVELFSSENGLGLVFTTVQIVRVLELLPTRSVQVEAILDEIKGIRRQVESDGTDTGHASWEVVDPESLTVEKNYWPFRALQGLVWESLDHAAGNKTYLVIPKADGGEDVIGVLDGADAAMAVDGGTFSAHFVPRPTPPFDEDPYELEYGDNAIVGNIVAVLTILLMTRQDAQREDVSSDFQNPGGIDLDSAVLEMDVKGEGLEVNLPDLDVSGPFMNVNGFHPVIINIAPANLPLLLGSSDEDQEEKNERSYHLTSIVRERRKGL